MITWFNDDGTLTDVFVMDFKSGIVSDVAPNPAPARLGTVKILATGVAPDSLDRASRERSMKRRKPR